MPFNLPGASGKPGNWSTWWIMDGGDDCNHGWSKVTMHGIDMLRSADVGGSLNNQVVEMQRDFHPWHFMKRVMLLDLRHTRHPSWSGGLYHGGWQGNVALQLR